MFLLTLTFARSKTGAFPVPKNLLMNEIGITSMVSS